MNDWKGNKNSCNAVVGYCPNGDEREANDYYATSPVAIEWLLKLEELDSNIWECACGGGHMAKALTDNGYNVKATDLVDRGYGVPNVDFLEQGDIFNGDIVTNPPFRYAEEFIAKALELVPDGKKVCMFLKLQFLEGQKRKAKFLRNPPKRIWVSSSRIVCGKNGIFSTKSMVAYAWYIWEKGYNGKTTLSWFN